jgi:hypothetical protein
MRHVEDPDGLLAGEGYPIPKRINGIAKEHDPTRRAGLQYKVKWMISPSIPESTMINLNLQQLV